MIGGSILKELEARTEQLINSYDELIDLCNQELAHQVKSAYSHQKVTYWRQFYQINLLRIRENLIEVRVELLQQQLKKEGEL